MIVLNLMPASFKIVGTGACLSLYCITTSLRRPVAGVLEVKCEMSNSCPIQAGSPLLYFSFYDLLNVFQRMTGLDRR